MGFKGIKVKRSKPDLLNLVFFCELVEFYMSIVIN